MVGTVTPPASRIPLGRLSEPAARTDTHPGTPRQACPFGLASVPPESDDTASRAWKPAAAGLAPGTGYPTNSKLSRRGRPRGRPARMCPPIPAPIPHVAGAAPGIRAPLRVARGQIGCPDPDKTLRAYHGAGEACNPCARSPAWTTGAAHTASPGSSRRTMRIAQGSGNRVNAERRTRNDERGTGSGERRRGTANAERRTGNAERGTGSGEPPRRPNDAGRRVRQLFLAITRMFDVLPVTHRWTVSSTP
jgi:hypothetical protein